MEELLTKGCESTTRKHWWHYATIDSLNSYLNKRSGTLDRHEHHDTKQGAKCDGTHKMSAHDSGYVDENADDDEFDEDISEVEKEQKSERNNVRFAEFITVRPIPAVGKGKPTPARGTSAVSATWHSGRNADIGSIDRPKTNEQTRRQRACICGGQLRKGDGKLWSDAEVDEVCLACASRWHDPTRAPGGSAQRPIDSVEIVHWPDSTESEEDPRGVQIQEDKFGHG